LPNPVTHWSKALRVGDVTKDPYRPPIDKGLVYVLAGGPDRDKDILYVGGGHATKNAEGRARIGTMIGAMLGFGLWNLRGIKIADEFPFDEVVKFYLMWGVVEGCPIRAERELLTWHLKSGLSPRLVASKPRQPTDTAYCRKVCIPERRGWSSVPCP
jgi:hypothetical protein